jgi:hypothetical protein
MIIKTIDKKSKHGRQLFVLVCDLCKSHGPTSRRKKYLKKHRELWYGENKKTDYYCLCKKCFPLLPGIE